MAELQFGPSGCPLAGELIRHWPEKSQAVARITADRYGAPDEALPSRLFWYENRPWAWTIIYRDEVQHNFPGSHTDVIEQAIRYRVPVARIPEILAFHGGFKFDRVKGEVSVRCGREESNFLAINLMHEILQGRLSVEDARRQFGEKLMLLVRDQPPDETRRFGFELPTGDTADRDVTTVEDGYLDITDLLSPQD